MPALARGQENLTSIVNWFITVNGILTDAFEVGYQILDISGGLPGAVVFPVPGDDAVWEEVTNAPGKFSVGSYYAYDNTIGAGYTPGIAEPVGTHRIKWRWKITGAAPYQADQEDFEVLVQSGGSSADTYITVQDIRDQGITAAVVDDATVLAYIETWQQFLDRACRQWFNPRAMILELNGNDSDTLFFGVPIIQIDYIKLNGSADELITSLYKAYTSRTYPDDRRNPRIKLRGPGGCRDIYSAPMALGQLKFRKGVKNQEVKGIFGFTEADGSVPKMIQRALLKLVVEKLTSPVYPSGVGVGLVPTGATGQIIQEKTDDHEIRFSDNSRSKKHGLDGITNDYEVLDIIRLYRAPIGVATPADWTTG
jgi:hypothetical protein